MGEEGQPVVRPQGVRVVVHASVTGDLIGFYQDLRAFLMEQIRKGHVKDFRLVEENVRILSDWGKGLPQPEYKRVSDLAKQEGKQ